MLQTTLVILQSDVPNHCTQFIKSATVGPCGRAKFFRDCARSWFLNAKMHNFSPFFLFWVIFVLFWGCFPSFVCAKLSDTNCFCAKQLIFRKSATPVMLQWPSKPSLVGSQPKPRILADVVGILSQNSFKLVISSTCLCAQAKSIQHRLVKKDHGFSFFIATIFWVVLVQSKRSRI